MTIRDEEEPEEELVAAGEPHPSHGRRADGSLDVTHGVIWKQLIQLLWPVFVASFVQQAYQLVNTFVVGHFASSVALGGIQATQPFTDLAIGFCVGVGSGCAVIVGQYFGAKDDERMHVASCTAMVLALIIGFAVGLLAFVLIGPLLRIVRTPAELMGEASAYGHLFFLALPLSLVYNMGAGIMRAVGDTRTPTVILAMSLAVAAGLDMVFVAALHLEALGCGISYLISYGVAALLTARQLAQVKGPWGVRPSELHLDRRTARLMLATGLPLGIQSSAYSISNVVVQVAINSFNDASLVAGWGLAMRIDGIVWLLSDALGIAVTTFAAQNFGARNFERMRACLRDSLVMSFVVVEGIMGIIIVFAEPIARFFVSDPDVIAPCVEMLSTIGPYYFLYSISANISGIIRGSGESLRPMLLTLVGTCILRIIWIVTVVPIHHSEFALLLGYPITWTVTDVMFVWYYFQGHWLTHAEEHEAKVLDK